MSSTKDERLQAVAVIACDLERETGLPAELMVAQWAVESRWGERPAGNANYFGIKRAARHQKFATTMTREVIKGQQIHASLQFADYDSLEESCRDYAWLITEGTPYRKAWRKFCQDGRLADLISGIAGVYATDPKYAQLLLQVAEQPNVKSAIYAHRD